MIKKIEVSVISKDIKIVNKILGKDFSKSDDFSSFVDSTDLSFNNELERDFLNVFGAEKAIEDSVYFCRLYDNTNISEKQSSGVINLYTKI